MENNSKNFDQLFKDKLENFEVSYDSAHWDEFETKLDTVTPPSQGNGSFGKLITFGGSAAVLAVAGYLYFSSNDINNDEFSNTTNQQTIESNEVTDEPIPNSVEAEEPSNYEAVEKDQPTSYKDYDGKDEESNRNSDQNGTSNDDQPSLEEQITKISSNNSEAIQEQSSQYIKDHITKKVHPSTKNFENEKLKTDFTASSKVACIGEEVRFTTDRDIKNASYFWDFGDGGLTSTKKNPTKIFTKAGTFDIRLLVSTGEKNTYTVEHEQFIEVKEAPVFDFNWDMSNLTPYDPYTEFEVETNQFDLTYSWVIENVKYSGKNPEHIFKTKGMFQAALTVNSNGCSLTKEKNIDVQKTASLPIENTFTVNGDGINDEFPKILSTISVPFQLRILDKTGKLLHETNDPNNPWNGRVNNSGDYVIQDFYKCVLITTDKYGKEHPQIQNFRVLR